MSARASIPIRRPPSATSSRPTRSGPKTSSTDAAASIRNLTPNLMKLSEPRRACSDCEGNKGGDMSVKIKRSVYADMFGPTTGDRVRLADTDLIIEVEKD